MIRRISLIISLFVFSLFSQPKKCLNSSEIKLALEKLNVLGSVLYLAAHPDDENTQFLTYFNYGRKLRTGYLSLTRGDGGQNLIGDEQGDLLGVIRTQELLQARNIDGAEQFFTRAIDFGYSKTPEETLNKWGKENILSDVVWVIRKFKPDVIVTRFPPNGLGTHGHHTASALLALEAFRIANNPNAFPEQIKYVQPWQPKKIYWNAWIPALKSMGINSDTLLKINFGEYNQLLGKSYTEISAESRTMHKSQGFGDTGRRINYYNYFLNLEGKPVQNDLFEDIDLSWKRVKGSEKVSELLAKANNEFDYEHPDKIVPTLIKAYNELQKLDDKYWVEVKSKELLRVIESCLGIWMEAVTEENLVSPGSELKVTAGIVNRSDVPVTLKSIIIEHQLSDSTFNSQLIKGEMLSVERKILIPENFSYTQPYWLAEKNHKDIYSVTDQILIGKAENDFPVYAKFKTEIDGFEIEFKTPVFYRNIDPVKGEVYKSLEIVPEAVVNFQKELYLVKNGDSKEVTVFVKSIKGKLTGKIKLVSDQNWKITPEYYEFSFNDKGEEKEFKFLVTPSGNSITARITANIETGNKILTKGLVTLDYPHIQPQVILPEASTKILKLDLKKSIINKIAYIMGSGDKIPDLLKDLGFTVDVFTKEPLTTELLSNYDVVITGIRAYNTNNRLATDQPNILKYVDNGGTLLVQYNTLGDMLADPFPFKLTISRDRVTEEDCKVKILDPNNSLLNNPYKITGKDFDGWVQERGLYFSDEWDERFIPLLEMNDNGETPKAGSLLLTNYGKGKIIYTGLSFFRQLPAGVEGAYKLFINLLSAGTND